METAITRMGPSVRGGTRPEGGPEGTVDALRGPALLLLNESQGEMYIILGLASYWGWPPVASGKTSCAAGGSSAADRKIRLVKYGAKQIRKRKICIGEVRLLRICPRQVRTAEVQCKSDPSLSCDTKTGA